MRFRLATVLLASVFPAISLGQVSGLVSQPAPPTPRTGQLPPGITPETKAAIDRGLAYLARVQSREGSWSNRGQYGAYPVSMTALAGLALLMDGNTTTQGRYAPQVDRAARFITRMAGPTGLIEGQEHEGRPMYGHGFSMLFLSQLYGMTEDPDRGRQIHDILVRGVELSGKGQSQQGGWYYTPDARNDEGSVTITQVQALRSCRSVGVMVPKAIIDNAMDYLTKSQNSDGGIRYSLRMAGGNSRPAITAAAVCCWFNAGEYNNPRAKQALAFAKQKIKPGSTEGGHDYYAHLYLSQALYLAKDSYWEEYFSKRRDFLLAQQSPDGYWSGDGVGDIYGTAIALIILQLPYNQLPIMQP
jgi:hypothetical protein